MRRRTCSKKRTETEKVGQQPSLSGAYIRSLVKQLTSSRKASSQSLPKLKENLEGAEGISSTKMVDGFRERVPQQHKKQVRRRLQTTKPYQERLLNMAEARREIVTALKFHRAAMKQQQQQQNSRFDMQHSMEPVQENPAPVTQFRNYNSSWICNPPPPYNSSVFLQESMNFPLPNQTLGLNLNFRDFNNLDTISCHSPSIYSYSPPSSSSSSSSSSSLLPVLAEETVPTSMLAAKQGAPLPLVAEDSGLHPAMGDKEIAKIRSIGEQHQMEFNDKMNLVTSACWFKFLDELEIGSDEKTEEFGASPFDEFMEFPAWLNADQSCLQNLNDYCSDVALLQHPALRWCSTDIEEIEGIDDADWLA